MYLYLEYWLSDWIILYGALYRRFTHTQTHTHTHTLFKPLCTFFSHISVADADADLDITVYLFIQCDVYITRRTLCQGTEYLAQVQWTVGEMAHPASTSHNIQSTFAQFKASTPFQALHLPF